MQYIQPYLISNIIQSVTRRPIEDTAEIKILLNIQQTPSSTRGIQTYEHRVKLWARYGAGFCECGLLGLCYARLPAYSVCVCNFDELSQFLPSVSMGIIFPFPLIFYRWTDFTPMWLSLIISLNKHHFSVLWQRRNKLAHKSLQNPPKIQDLNSNMYIWLKYVYLTARKADLERIHASYIWMEILKALPGTCWK